MRVAVIINPASGLKSARMRGRESRRDRIARWTSEAGVSVDILETTGHGHAAEICAAIAAAGHDRVVVWGGDGTINEAAAPLVGTTTALGIIRGGSGDGLAGSLGLPRDPQEAFLFALRAAPGPIDVGWLGDRHFLNIAGVGFDAEVSHRFNRQKSRGTRGYVVEALRAVWMYRCEEYTLTAGGQTRRGPHFLIAFANGREYGSGLVITPHSDLSDGRLEMVVVDGGGPLRQFWRARRLFLRPLKPAEGILRETVTSATISGTDLRCHVDGETFDATGALELRIQPAALNVIGAGGSRTPAARRP